MDEEKSLSTKAARIELDDLIEVAKRGVQRAMAARKQSAALTDFPDDIESLVAQ